MLGRSNALKSILRVVVFLTILGPVYAQLTIEGAGGETRPYRMALPLIEGDEPNQSGTLQAILHDDFRLSGLMTPIGLDQQGSLTKPNIAVWKDRQAEFLIVGKITKDPEAIPEMRPFLRIALIRIFDVARHTELEGIKAHYDNRQVAIAAHQLADTIIERVTGIKVGLSQLVAMVVNNGGEYDIRVSDISGKNSHSILRSSNPIIGLSWSPNGQKIAYTSFENDQPQIFIQDIASGDRMLIAESFESASSPAWSPDGKRLAFSAYTNEKTSIYEYALQQRTITPLVEEGTINTEPVYSKDGFLYFSSNRGSSPQIYRMNLANRETKRFSFNETYCVRPTVSTSERSLVAYLNQGGVGVTVVDNQQQKTYSLGHIIERYADSVALSPRGRLILLSVADQKGFFQIIISNIHGSFQKLIDLGEYNFYEPAWQP